MMWESKGGMDMNNLWIARDKNGFLRLFGEEPYMNKKRDEWEPIIGSIWLNDGDFPEVTWENSPMQVELKLFNNHANNKQRDLG